MSVESFDVVIVGAGSGGENLAATLAGAGRDVAIVEAHLVGGECPFLACMPSKAMVRSAEVRSLLFRVQELGAMGDALNPHLPDEGWARAVARRDDIIDHGDDTEHARELVDAGVTVIRGRGRLVGDGHVEVRTTEGGDEPRLLRGTDIVIATGTTAVVPPIAGIDDVPTWTSDEAWTATDRPRSAIVLGGGPVGCEIAQVLVRFGVDVTVVEQAEQLAGGEEPAVADVLAEVFRGEGITVALGAKAERAERTGEGVRLHLSDGSAHEAERLVLAVGRAPSITDIGLEALGIGTDAPLAIDDRCRVVGQEHLWAVGDVTGVAPFTHTANHHARVLADVLLGGDARAQTRAIPRAVYTDPPVAGVGMTAQEARAAGLAVEVATMDLSQTARHAADGGPGGHLVLVADADRRVLVGASAVGVAAPEWMTQLVLGIHAELPLATLAEVIQPFPAHAEALQPCLAELRDRVR